MYITVCPFTRSFSDEWLTYSVSNRDQILPWYIVEIPYGSKVIDAVVLSVWSDSNDIKPEKIKEIQSIKYDTCFLHEYQIELLLYISKYYFCLLHASLALFFPKNLKEKIWKKTFVLKSDRLNYEYNNDQILTNTQSEKLSEIRKSSFKQILLYWVTWSGKTSLYVELIREQLLLWKQSLLLVPEIILTSQIALTMQKIFWENVLVIHSSISEANKTKNWMKIYNGEAKVIIGTRSALFYPYTNLGRIIIDEEHDRSYRSDNSPRYNAWEVAAKISALQWIPLLLWSGTPSTTTMYKAVKKQIWLVTLLEEYQK